MDLITLVPDALSSNRSRQHLPRVIHDCEVPKPVDESPAAIEGSDLAARARRWIRSKCVLSRSHPSARNCTKSTAAVNYEISRHLGSYPYMIHPFSSFRMIWEALAMSFSVLALVVAPFLVAFPPDSEKTSVGLVLMIDFAFWCDIGVSFLTGRYERDVEFVVLDPRIVARKYLTGCFPLDVLTAIPFELIGMSTMRDGKMRWYCASFNLAKIVKIRTVIVNARRVRHAYRLPFRTYKIAEMIVILALIVHWAACIEYHVPFVVRKYVEPAANRTSWIDEVRNETTTYRKYVASLIRATIALVCSVHHLEVRATEDVVVNFSLTVVGRIGFVYVLAQLLQLTTILDSGGRHPRLLQQLREYTRYKELPFAVQRRLLAYRSYCDERSCDRERRIVARVSPHLRRELRLHNCGRLARGVEFFRLLPSRAFADVVTALRSEIYLTDDTIVEAGIPGEALYLIASGTVAVYTSGGKEVCHLEDGAHFGEMALMTTSNEQQGASVVAVEICELYVLTRDDFRRSVAPYPNLFGRLQRLAFASDSRRSSW